MSCQRYTDDVMIMTVKKLSCWFNSGWSHLQSVGEDVSLESMCFLCSRGFANARLRGAEELWPENWHLNTSNAGWEGQWTVRCVWVYTCNGKFRMILSRPAVPREYNWLYCVFTRTHKHMGDVSPLINRWYTSKKWSNALKRHCFALDPNQKKSISNEGTPWGQPFPSPLTRTKNT